MIAFVSQLVPLTPPGPYANVLGYIFNPSLILAVHSNTCSYHELFWYSDVNIFWQLAKYILLFLAITLVCLVHIWDKSFCPLPFHYSMDLKKWYTKLILGLITFLTVVFDTFSMSPVFSYRSQSEYGTCFLLASSFRYLKTKLISSFFVSSKCLNFLSFFGRPIVINFPFMKTKSKHELSTQCYIYTHIETHISNLAWPLLARHVYNIDLPVGDLNASPHSVLYWPFTEWVI